MVQCPVCGAENPPEAANCGSCQLATSLFEPVREVAGATSDDASAARAIAEILAAVGPEQDSAEPVDSGGAGTLQTAQARFPALNPVRASPVATASRMSLPALPVLAPGSGISLAQRQIEELLAVGRREGIDLGEADQKMLAALKDEDHSALDELRRSLFVQVAATVAEDLEIQSGRRNELAALVPTPAIDVELESSRTAFAAGDLPVTVRRLRQTSESLSTLEDRWATCQILSTEADLMIETLRELGEDPAQALGPLSEGRRLARAGEEARAEKVLAGANRVLWGLLVPQMNRSLQAIRTQLEGHVSSEGKIEPVVRELRQLSAMIRRRNLGSAVTSYRRLRQAAMALSAPAGG
jgi:hypothetical protein